MAAGDRRHYKVDGILPRRFYQSGSEASLAEATIRRLFAELVVDAPLGIRSTRAAPHAGSLRIRPTPSSAASRAGARLKQELDAPVDCANARPRLS